MKAACGARRGASDATSLFIDGIQRVILAISSGDPRVLVWGLVTDGLGDIDTILKIRSRVIEKYPALPPPTTVVLAALPSSLATLRRHITHAIDAGQPSSIVRPRNIRACELNKVNLVLWRVEKKPLLKVLTRRDAADKLLRKLSEKHDKTIAFRNLSVCRENGYLLTTSPMGAYDESLYITEYDYNVATMWLETEDSAAHWGEALAVAREKATAGETVPWPAQSPLAGKYYFAYFWDDKGSSLARYLLHLRNLILTEQLSEAGGERNRVFRVVTNCECTTLLFPHRLKSLMIHAQEVCNPCRCDVHFNGHEHVAIDANEEGVIQSVEIGGFEFLIERIGYVSPQDFDNLLYNAENFVGCTGDSSLSKAISYAKLPLYQVMWHKVGFVFALLDVWEKQVKGDVGFFNEMLLRRGYEYRVMRPNAKKLSQYKQDFEKFIAFWRQRNTRDEINTFLDYTGGKASNISIHNLELGIHPDPYAESNEDEKLHRLLMSHGDLKESEGHNPPPSPAASLQSIEEETNSDLSSDDGRLVGRIRRWDISSAE